MKRAGIVGWPLSHSLSPVLHGYWLNQLGLEGEFVKLPAAPEDFAATIATTRAQGFTGVNVTVPHKEAAFGLADEPRPAARIAGAANLLVFTSDGRIGADNTDSSALADSLEDELGIGSLAGKHIVLLGAGGAARGAAYGLQTRGAAKISILNRNVDRAKNLADRIQHYLPEAKFAPRPLEDWSDVAKDAWLVINTTSAGMAGSPPLAIDLSALPQTAAVCDIVYNPLTTEFLKDAAARGHKTIDGLGMLMHQAVPSFESFFGVRPQVSPGLRAALEKALA